MVIASDCPRISVPAPIDFQDQPIGVETAEGLGECNKIDEILSDLKLFLNDVIRMRDDKDLTPTLELESNWEFLNPPLPHLSRDFAPDRWPRDCLYRSQ